MAVQLMEEANENFNKKVYNRAEKQYTNIIEKYGHNCEDENTQMCVVQAFNNRGQIKYLRVDFDEAIEDYTAALNINNSYEVILYNRGLIHYRLGRYTQAIADFNASLDLKPDFKDSIEALKTATFEQLEKGDRIAS